MLSKALMEGSTDRVDKVLLQKAANPYKEIRWSDLADPPSRALYLVGCNSLFRLAMFCGDLDLIQWYLRNRALDNHVAHGECLV